MRNNPAQANRWNAWRYPTSEEIERGRREEDMYWVGAAIRRADARALLDGRSGQLQWGRDGEVVNVEEIR